jgi:hypothetical protein
MPLSDELRVPTRDELFSLLEQAIVDPNSAYATALNNAVRENDEIDSAVKRVKQTESDIDHITAEKTEKFPMLNGSAYRHPGVPQKAGSTLCSDYHVKDRKFSDLIETSNHSIGADTHRKMLLFGCLNGSSMLSSLLLKPHHLLRQKYEEVAAHFGSGLTLSLLHLRNCTIAITGTLDLIDVD